MDAYTAVYRLLRAGCLLDRATVQRLLDIDGQHGWDDLLDDVLLRRTQRPGDRCLCGGRLSVYCSKRRPDGSRVQYLRCGKCKRRPPRNKRILPP